jgi:hypothetical protein
MTPVGFEEKDDGIGGGYYYTPLTVLGRFTRWFKSIFRGITNYPAN